MQSVLKRAVPLAAALLVAATAARAAGFDVRVPFPSAVKDQVAAAQTAPQAQAAAKHASRPAPAMHAMKGVVKSIDDKTLVLTRSGRNHADATFVVSASTQRDGAIAAGEAVSVRYRDEGKSRIATAIRVAPVKQQPPHSTPKR